MKKNILVLIGSARVGGNSYLLSEAFIKGAIQSGHEVVKYEVGKKKNNLIFTPANYFFISCNGLL